LNKEDNSPVPKAAISMPSRSAPGSPRLLAVVSEIGLALTGFDVAELKLTPGEIIA
jgi:hypothetical protein